MSVVTRALVASFALVAVTGCGSNEAGPPVDGTYTLTISGDEVSDTILTRVGPLLTATVRQGSRPASGVWVRFRPLRDGGGYGCLNIAPLNSDYYYTDELAGKTDSQGRFQVKVEFSYLAGPSLILAQLGDTTASDTAAYNVLPGNPNSVQVWGDPDTAVVLDASYTPRVSAYDAGGNALDLPVTITSLSPAVAAVSGSVVTGRSYGRAVLRLTATSGSWMGEDTASVTVVPPGLFLATRNNTSAVVNADGSDFTYMLNVAGYGAFAPGGQTIAYTSYWTEGMLLLNQHGDTLRQLLPPPGPVSALYPAFSRDGNWVYFCGAPTFDPGQAIFRVHPDATGREQLTGVAPELPGSDCAPSPSPDGNRIVYQKSRGGTAPRLVIKNLTTGVVTELGVPGSYPSWSPSGDRIAYWQVVDYPGITRLYLINPSGGPAVEVPLPGMYVYAQHAPIWSPDGQWLAVGAASALGSTVLVRLSDSQLLALPWTRDKSVLDWTAGTVN